MSELLQNLNEAQKAAVVDYDCPSLIIAGAGSGKTRVLTSRIAYMLDQGIPPHRILALTFTNKAAREMRERIAKMVSPQLSNRLWMGTFHSIFLRILRAEADKLGYTSSFTIYDSSDSRNLIKSIVKEMNLNDDNYKPNALHSRISLAKNNLVTAQAYESNTNYIAEDRQRKIPEFVEIYKIYSRRCLENGAMDFDDLLLNINILLRDFPDILAKYQERFMYILVDEYQDTNYAQYIIIRRLAQLHSRVCVVGDDAQSIYSFRGAKIENILRFRNDFPGAKTFKLEQNYRSTKTIVNAANSVIEKNKNRLEKISFSQGEHGEKIKVIKAYTDQEEASMVADEIRSLMRSGSGLNQIALLYRTNMQSRVFEEAFRRRGIPYRIYGGMSFYQRKEIKDMLAYFHLIVNPHDDEAFKRVINYPARGIGAVTLGKIGQAAASANISMLEFIGRADLKNFGFNSGTAAKVKDFANLIASFRELLPETGLYDFGLEIATRTGIIGSYKIENTPEAQSALDNIEELLNSIQLYCEQVEQEERYDSISGEPLEGHLASPSLVDWLQSVTLMTDMDQDKGEEEHLTMMTVHSAKGLEFDSVFIVGLEENLFPSMMSMDGADGLEEERRLFYVALTRARERAFLSCSETRFKWGSMEFCRPSRFLAEIDQEYLDIAFDPDEEAKVQTRSSILRKNYEDHNRKHYAPTAKERSATDGYGHGQTIKGAAARQYPVNTKEPVRPATAPPAPDLTRFRSIGSRPAASNNRQEASSFGSSLSDNYAVGQRVAHQKFGNGTITAIEQMAGDRKITVDFDKFGTKTLLSKFARLMPAE